MYDLRTAEKTIVLVVVWRHLVLGLGTKREREDGTAAECQCSASAPQKGTRLFVQLWEQ